MATTAWRGAVEIAGFNIHVALYNRVKSRSSESFKMIAPTDKLPVRSVLLDTDGQQVERASTLKGVMTGKDTYAVLKDKDVEAIQSAERSDVVTADQFVPIESLDFELSLTAYAVRPDLKVPGSEKSLQTFWNGLLDAKVAYVTTVTMKAGKRDSILALYADKEGLWAITLPFSDEVNAPPEFEFERDKKQGAALKAFITDKHTVEPFDTTRFQSTWRERRDAAIEAAVSGKKSKAPSKQAAAKPAAGDLMAALQQSTAKAKRSRSKKAVKA